MKQKLLNSLRLRACMLVAVLCAGVSAAWGAEGDVHDMGISFSKLLNNNAVIDPVNISAQSYPVKAVTINWKYNKSTADVVTIEVKVAGTSWGTKSVGTNTTADVVFEGTAVTGDVEITFTNNAGSGTGKGTFYVNSVKLTEGASGSATETCATPTFNPAAGTYTEAQSVTISCATTGATIYYTTDGNNPTTSSSVYSGAISVSETTTIKAIAVKDGMDNSAVASATYTIVEPFVIEDGIFDFESKRSDYGSGVSTTSANEYIEEEKTWTAGNVTLVTSGKYRWWDNDGTLRFYNNDPASAMTFSVPEGKVIKSIVITGGQAFTASLGTYANGTWTGQARSVTLCYAASSGSVNVKTVTVTYGDPENVKVDIATINGISPVELTVGDNGDFTLDATFAEGVTDEDYTIAWASENTDVVGLDGKAYEAKAAGTANVTVTITPNDTETYNTVTKTFAVTVKEEEVAGNWVLTSLADLTSTDVFVIVGNNGDTYALSNDNGTNAPAAVKVTVSGDYLTGTIADNIKWNISVNDNDDYTFYPNGDSEKWLYCTNTNNGVKVGTNENNTFIIEDGYLKHVATSRYVGIYSSQDWRCYGSTDGNIANQTFAFYKFEAGSPVPSITANNVEIAYGATSGEIEYSINNPADNGQLTATSTSDWLTLGTNFTSPIAFTCSANETRIARTADIVLTYTYGEGSSVSKTVTVTQAGNPNYVDEISSITETGKDYAIRGTIVAKSSRGLVFGDGSGYVYYYNQNGPSGNVGDIKKVSGTIGSYSNVLQFTNSATIEDAETSNFNNAPVVTVVDASSMAAYSEGLHLSDYVQFEGTLVKSGNYYNIQVNGLETDASISYPTDEQKTALDNLENKNVVVKGYFSGVSGGHFSVVLESIEEAVSETVEVMISAAATDGSVNYGTLYYSNKNLTVPDGLTAYTASVSNGSLTLSAVTGAIPANTGVVLKTNSKLDENTTFTFTEATEGGTVVAGNMLKGNDEDAETTGGAIYYQLSRNANKDPYSIGFYWGAAYGASFTNKAHRAYLAVPAGTTTAKGFAFSDITDGIGQVENGNMTMEKAEIYNLAGQKVNKAQKGIYIVNGKKIVIK